jgi:hypothetical protein
MELDMVGEESAQEDEKPQLMDHSSSQLQNK